MWGAQRERALDATRIADVVADGKGGTPSSVAPCYACTLHYCHTPPVLGYTLRNHQNIMNIHAFGVLMKLCWHCVGDGNITTAIIDSPRVFAIGEGNGDGEWGKWGYVHTNLSSRLSPGPKTGKFLARPSSCTRSFSNSCRIKFASGSASQVIDTQRHVSSSGVLHLRGKQPISIFTVFITQ